MSKVLEMLVKNKTVLIAGGACVASLAVGSAGGYLVAKRRFVASLPEIIEAETLAVKKHYSLMAMNAMSGKPASPADIVPRNTPPEEPDDEDSEDPEPVELTAADLAAREKGREILRRAQRAMTDYQGISNKPISDTPAPTEVEQHNIFEDAKKKKPRPSRERDPESGRFVPQAGAHREPEDPYIISQEDFLLNDPDFDQENLKYFVRDKTLLMVVDNEEVDIARVGEVNLTLFPQVPRDEPSIICVRNEGFGIDYEIQLTHESVTDHMGLGESDEDERVDQSAYL